MAVEICRQIGICKVDKDGNVAELQREYFRQGWIFKDWEAFQNKPDLPCYVPELSDTVYTARDFLRICKGQEEFAYELFEGVDWQHPETLIEDWYINGEVDDCRKCGKMFDCYEATKCPYCGADYEGGNG